MKKNNFNSSFNQNMDKFANMNEDQLMCELLKYANMGKQDGTINNEKLDAFYLNASMFMNSEQQEKLKSLINLIKNS